MADHPFKSLTKAVGGSVVSAGKSSAEFSSYIDTGSYILNGLFSGKLRGGGWPDNKVLALAGESTTGKTFFMFGVAKCFQDKDPTAGFMLFDTEAATTSAMMRDRGMDADRVIIKEPLTVQDFRTDAMRFLDAYLAIPPAKRPPFMMGLDSLGALSTAKEVADIGEGNDVRDMTRQQLLRGAFRTLRLKLSAAHVPMIVTNHTYAGIGPYAGQEMSGGGGLKFAADAIAFLSKKKYKEGEEVVGNVIHVTMKKSRVSQENRRVDVLLTYRDGLDRYYGLFDLGKKYGVFTKALDENGKSLTKNRAPLWLVAGTDERYTEREIYKRPVEVFKDAVMDLLEVAADNEFTYGAGEIDAMTADLESEVEDVHGELELLQEGGDGE